jgi:hypothetical protein
MSTATTLNEQTSGFTHYKLGGQREKIIFKTVGFDEIVPWRDNVRESEPVTIKFDAKKEAFLKQLEKYPALKNNALRLKRSLRQFLQTHHILVQENNQKKYISYEGNSRACALRMLKEENPNEFRFINIAIVPKHVKAKHIVQFVEHIHMTKSFLPKDWSLTNRAKKAFLTLKEEGNSGLKKLAKEDKDNAIEEGRKAESSADFYHNAVAHNLSQLDLNNKSKTKLEKTSEAISWYIIFAKKEKLFPGLQNCKSQSFKKISAAIEAAVKSGMKALDLRKYVILIPGLKLSVIKKAGREGNFEEILENADKKSIKKGKSQNAPKKERKNRLIGNLKKAKDLIHQSMEHLKKLTDKDKKNYAKDFLRSILSLVGECIKIK